jgi:hypothetical protein
MSALPGISRLNRFVDLYRLVKNSGYFDARWYRTHSSGTRLSPNPIIHYALFGWRAGLNPSPRFDTRYYWDSYRDVRELNANPLIHYLLHGQKEGRLATTSGKEVRHSTIAEQAPLPLFEAPSTHRQRLSVVIDDYTPKVAGLGLTPQVALAHAVAHRHGFLLRFILRSDNLTRHDLANATPEGMPAADVDVVVRSPGSTADVECVEGEIWWATSAPSLWSLRDFVPTDTLWWLITANETSRTPAGELRLITEAALADPEVSKIVVGRGLVDSLTLSGSPTVIAQTPVWHRPADTATPHTLAVVLDDTQGDILIGPTLKLIEEGLAHSAIDPSTWTIRLLGHLTRPITLTGSVHPELASPASASEWAREVSSASVVVALGAGSEPGYLAELALSRGARVVVTDSDNPYRDTLLAELHDAIQSGKKKSVSTLSGADAAASLDSVWGT